MQKKIDIHGKDALGSQRRINWLFCVNVILLALRLEAIITARSK
jgi:hypothetical protein